jgi:hypothetical protein
MQIGTGQAWKIKSENWEQAKFQPSRDVEQPSTDVTD